MTADGFSVSRLQPADDTRAVHGGWRRILTDSARLTLLAAVSLGVGWLVNGARRHPLPWSYRTPSQRLQDVVLALQSSTVPGATGTTLLPTAATTVDLEAFQAFVSARKGTVIDARGAAFYQQGHVPGALSLPRETFAADYPRVKSRLDARRAGQIVVYCSETDCPDAAMVAGALTRLDYEQVRIYPGGWDEWTHAGLPEESTATP